MSRKNVAGLSEIANTGPQSESCCSAFYEQDWVRKLAEDSFHPGGEALTRRTVDGMNLQPGASVVDLGCGSGTTALLLERDFGLSVSGVDLGAANVALARRRAEQGEQDIDFMQADAHDLPFAGEFFDGVLAECAFSLFTDQPAALAEIRRILKPGGAFALTDMAAGGPLPDDLAGLIAPWTCLEDARTQEEYLALFENAGFRVLCSADESDALRMLLASLKRKLLVLGVGALLAESGMPQPDLATVKYWLDRFGQEVDRGHIRYLRFQLKKAPF